MSDTNSPTVGDLIIMGGRLARVTAILDHPAGPHAGPVRADMPAREWVTDRGSRWSGIRPDGTPHNTPTPYGRARARLDGSHQ
jgi:hypothetical protein